MSLPSGISLRPVETADEGFLRAVFESTRVELLALLPPELAEMQFRAQQFHYSSAYPEALSQVIFFEQTPVGAMRTSFGSQEITLIDIALLPAFRGKGIGSGLIGDLIREAENLELPLSLSVDPVNPARRLYERLGFVVTGSDGANLRMVRSGNGVCKAEPRLAGS